MENPELYIRAALRNARANLSHKKGRRYIDKTVYPLPFLFIKVVNELLYLLAKKPKKCLNRETYSQSSILCEKLHVHKSIIFFFSPLSRTIRRFVYKSFLHENVMISEIKNKLIKIKEYSKIDGLFSDAYFRRVYYSAKICEDFCQ